jgi:lipopolysaccharide transport system ATP-binding protein
MSDIVLTAEGLGKRYRIGAPMKRYRTFGDAIVHAASTPLRNLRRLRGLSSFGGGEEHDVVWALRDVSFQLRHGEAVGVVGRNGAGKSTLLKVLSRITRPTTGEARVRGRVGALLEVGTGFHPELTGRDNIYLNGSILGMDRAYIDRRFEEIVEFAGVAAFIDTPVKRFSSGMYLRLAFSVAAHLEPEILIVDEVLAVGDAEFQRKCLGKMEDVTGEGRTVLFVSHNMNAIQRLCSRSILLEGGRMVAHGETDGIVRRYLGSLDSEAPPARWIDLSGVERRGTGAVRLDAVRFSSESDETALHPYPDGPLEVELRLFTAARQRLGSAAVTFYDLHGTKLVNADTVATGHVLQLRPGEHVVRISIESLHLNPGSYTMGFWLADPMGDVFHHSLAALRVVVVDGPGRVWDAAVRGEGSVTCHLRDVRLVDGSLMAAEVAS